jgi:hypothetical protein
LTFSSERLKTLVERYPKLNVYVLNVFTNIDYLLQIIDLSKNIKFINIILVNNDKTFEGTIQKNLLKPGINIVREDLRASLHRKARKYLQEKLKAGNMAVIQ